MRLLQLLNNNFIEGFLTIKARQIDNVFFVVSILFTTIFRYRLAPEHPFPTPLEDCVNSTIEFFERANEFGVDANQIALAGDSAGKNTV